MALLPAAPASATLRSPHLSSSCASGYTYGEQTFYAFRVEGCHKEVTPQGSEGARSIYKGTVEVNGILIEGSGDLTATRFASNGDNIGKVARSGSDAKIVLDPKIGGSRRRLVIYTGTINLQAHSEPPTQFVMDGRTDIEIERQPVAGHIHHRITASNHTQGTMDLPVGSSASILGMRLRETIHDVAVTSSTDGTGSMVFTATLSLGSHAPSILGDNTSHVDIVATDGTGMSVTGLKFKIPNFSIPGIGGFKNMSLSYSSADDEWNGTMKLDLGELFFTIDLEVSVRASDGVPTYIRAEVDNLGIPIGSSGVYLQSVRAAFGFDPMVFSAGAGVTAGPQIAGSSLIRGDGDFTIAIEPHFRLDATATIRILPVGSGELARGDGEIILDSSGYLSIKGDARFEVSIVGIGIAADIGGSGAYATEHNQFNIEAHANGQLLLGFLGDFDVLQAKAVISNNGWGACAKLNFLLTAGVGQEWGSGVQLLTNCDLSAFKQVVHARVAQNGVVSQTFTVDKGTKELGVDVTASGSDPIVRLVAPKGNSITTRPQGNREIGKVAVVVAQPGKPRIYFGVAKPPAGTWKVEWPQDGPQVTNVATATDVPPLKASAAVSRKSGDRAGRRRLKIGHIAGLGPGEQVMIGVRTPTGVVPLGIAGEGGLAQAFDEVAGGHREIVATVLRNGLPLPTRTRVLKRYTEKLLGPPKTIERSRHRNKLKLKAVVRKGAEAPDAWQYIVRSKAGVFASVRAENGKAVVITLPNHQFKVRVTARPVLRGRVLDSEASVPVA